MLDRMQRDKRLSPRHISLLLALLSAWQSSGFAESFRVTRRELMRRGRIASTATYHKSIAELTEFRYIDYQPSYHPREGSRVRFLL
ncbi:MAG: hypothetical protein INR69_14240 [Mucilaginibacter polytrichastri]|nr:hypothetical protein [Mucilaginibacter polytrichastri]